MFSNYLRIAFRSFWKHRVFSAINILGLSIGFSAALVIWMMVYFDLSFDRFHPAGDRIYRVVSKSSSAVPLPVGGVLNKEVSGIERSALLYEFAPNVSIRESRQQYYFMQKNVAFTDAAYFDIIQYKWLYGSAAVLKAPGQLVLTEERAALYFPGVPAAEVIGREVIHDDSLHLTVAGVIAALPGRTDFHFAEFISMPTVHANKGLQEYIGIDRWNLTNTNSNLFVQLREGVSPEQVNRQLAGIPGRYGEDSKDAYALQPLARFHFDSRYELFGGRHASMSTLYNLTALVVFLLLLGCINFINLQTAQAAGRAREIGVRKTMGSSRGKLVLQFLGESTLLTVFAAGLAVCLVPLILKAFNDFIPDGVGMELMKDWQVFLFIPVLIVLVSLLAGLYPAFVMARFQPVLALKNSLHGVKGKTRLRQVLTVSQFAVALVLVIATFIVSKQTRYALHKELGFNKDNRISMFKPRGAKSLDALRQQLHTMPEVSATAFGFGAPLSLGTMATWGILGNAGQEEGSNIEVKYVDTAYVSFYNLHLLAGRNLTPSDTMREVIINETFARKAGFKTPEEALGQVFINDDRRYPVTGVVADFHSKSVHEPIKPLMLSTGRSYKNVLHVAFHKEADMRAAISKIEKEWGRLYPGAPFKYNFVDEALARFYQRETRLIKLLAWATGVAILISCLGLLGLAIYATRQRTKEIGIRKVLGASVLSIVALFSRNILMLVLIALLIASPLAWYMMHNWLNKFAYSIPVPWWVFPAAGSVAAMLALLTVGIQSVRAAMINPAHILKND